eukprot:TRINITY_DN7448_c0_g3_i4.p1 TRINITY_DN7448_c0_g3~~TRINITY_DN7448_c0_g3_i4.p1  ORF type:complete len:236 (+),score=18.10 TRINITY_DN7448_c0_g3_i4:90-797(+)
MVTLSPFFSAQSETHSSRKTNIMETHTESHIPQVFDQNYLKTLEAVFTSAFKNIQQEFDEADQFDQSKCPDFSPHPRYDQIGGPPKRLLLSFITTLCSVFPVFQRAWMKQNVYEKVRLHFRSSHEVDDIWKSFKTVQVDHAFLFIIPPDVFTFQVLVFKSKKRVRGCKVLIDNVPFRIAIQPVEELKGILTRLFLSMEDPNDNYIIDMDRNISGTNMVFTHMFVVLKTPQNSLFF